jgi:mutator protein MutT
MESQSHTHHRVVTGILVRDNRVLLCRRAASREWFPNVWDFPGGHVKEGETDDVALKRELREEIGVTVDVPPETEGRLLLKSDFEMRIWVIRTWDGDPSNLAPEEHREIGWFFPSEAQQLELAHGEYPEIISAAVLQL